ncbi:hypothetical protein HGRIS_013346 [Hohenbuehelia grisea]|uniref:Uncharacterized protein n=1 Tax=Hohenbuehelia grisea TaxID=104357 RepID=A0ABR3IVI1_9AGAR
MLQPDDLKLIKHSHPTDIFAVRACCNDDANDLLAIGGDHSVEVLQIESLFSYRVENLVFIPFLAWSSRTISPAAGEDWVLELTAAGVSHGLYLLTKSSTAEETVYPFGGGLHGHHGKITDMVFCGGHGEDSSRYVATVSDDKFLMVWDLYPPPDAGSRASASEDSVSPSARPSPTAYVVPFPHALTSVASHPSTSKEFLVSDVRGSIFLSDWRSDPEEKEEDSWRHSSLVEMVEPYAVAGASTGVRNYWSASVSWRRDNIDIVGAAYGSKFSIWDISSLQGGKPRMVGNTFADGIQRFRWCPTYPDYFAISSQSPAKGALLHVHNINYVHAQPNVLILAPRPHFIRDFDFLALPGIPRIAAAIGKVITIVSIGVDSET